MQDLFAWFDIFQTPPFSCVLIVGVSLFVSTLSNLAMKRFSDVRRLRRYQAEIKQYQEMQKEAERTGNEKLIRKIKRRKGYIERIQREMMSARCKPGLIFLIPFMIIFTLLRGFYFNDAAGIDRIVAIIPFNIQKVLPFLEGMIGIPTPAGFGLTFMGLYFLVGLGLGQMLQRIMGVSLT